MIAAFVPNVMDRSRFPAGVTFVSAAADALAATVVVIDLDRCDDIGPWAALDARTIGFGAHVATDTIEAAAEAGVDEVMARSAFFRRLPTLF